MAQTSEASIATAPERNPLDASIQEHSTLGISLLLLIGFAVRVWSAQGIFLNPDEAMHFEAGNQTSWWLAYRASLTLAHPPLLVLLLHGWRWLGTSELVLRMPSAIAGTIFGWLTFKWATSLFRPAVGWIALILTLFLPSTIDLSSEVRQYALMLAFAMASAYLLERALETDSAAAMTGSSVSLWLALGFHYSAFLFAAAVGAYAIVRMVARRPARKVAALWCAGQLITLGIGCFFYKTHLSQLNSGETASSAVYEWISAYLPNSYFVPGKINPLVFILARTGGFFQYAFGQLVAGDVAYVLFALGIIPALRNLALGKGQTTSLRLLLLLPFVVNCVAALAAVYPYGGTRHSAFLLPFALTGIAVGLAYLLNYRIAAGIAAAILVVTLCNLFASHRQPYISRPDQNIVHMQDAMGFIRSQIPSQDLIFTDRQGSVMLKQYLCGAAPVPVSESVRGFHNYECGGHLVVTPETPKLFLFTPRTFSQQWQTLVSNASLPPGTRVWVTQMGWNTHLAAELAALPNIHLVPHAFGQNIQIFDLTVGQSMPDPKLLPAS